jgi:hypothetical protein
VRHATRKRNMERKIVERLRLGDSIKRIGRDLSIGRSRIRTVRERAKAAGYLDLSKVLPAFPEALFTDLPDGRTSRGSPTWKKLEPHLERIKARLTSGWHAVSVYEELPVKVPRSNFYRFLEHHGLLQPGDASARVIPEIVHEPGEALLIDWGHLWNIERDGIRTKLWAFVAVLGYSRYMVVRLMTICDSQQTLSNLAAIFNEIGGVPLRITSDNPKVFARMASRYEPLLNPLYERFAHHYGTVIECLPPADPEKKGKVERLMPFVRRLLEAYEGDRNDIAAAQHYLDAKMVLANQRRHGTTSERPIDRFSNEEKKSLKPLPILPYEIELYHEGTIRVDGHVRFQGKYYSVDEEHIRHDVTVIGNSKLVSIYKNGTLLEVHDRIWDRNRSKSTKPHHLKPWQRACDNPDGLRKLARDIGPSVEIVVAAILKGGNGFIDLRRIWGILSLNKKFTPHEIDAACDLAFEAQILSYHAIVRFINDAREQAVDTNTTTIPTRPAGKYQRDLSEYTQMLLNLEPQGGSYEH